MNRFFIIATALPIFLLASCAYKKGTPQASAQTQPAAATQPRPQKAFFLQKWISSIPNLIPRKSAPPPAVPPQWIGVIRMVNTAEKFVLLESNAISAVIPGETYLAISNGKETASLRMTELKNPPFLIADIISGDPSPGEKIYLPQPSASPNPMASPKPVSSPKPARGESRKHNVDS